MDWNDYGEIAEALNELYPDRSPAVIEDAELLELVLTLPDFRGSSELPKDMYLSFIANKCNTHQCQAQAECA